MTTPTRTNPPWLPRQIELLERLAESGAPFRTISEQVGHPVFGCYSKIRDLRAQRRATAGQPKKIRVPKPPKATPVAAAPIFLQAAPGPAPLRAASTSKLVMDAELRARISEQGITAGLLGDPRPGRSALDRMKERSHD